jgi:hypothetical protein
MIVFLEMLWFKQMMSVGEETYPKDPTVERAAQLVMSSFKRFDKDIVLGEQQSYQY